MSHTIPRIGVLTGGGDCPGLNAVISSYKTRFLLLDMVGLLCLKRRTTFETVARS